MSNSRNRKTFFCITFIIILIVIILGLSHKYGTDYWENFWNIMAGIIGVIGAVFVFFLQTEKESNKTKIDRYLQLQNDVILNQATKIIDFDPDFIDKNETKHLVQTLASLLYSLQNADNQRKSIESYINDSDNNISDFSEINTKINEIIQNPQNDSIIKYLKSNYPDLAKNVSERSIVLENKNDYILGHWYMSEQRAKKAKYLIGVSTSEKTILGTFKIDTPYKIEKSNDTNRLYFGNASTPIYNAPAAKFDKTKMPGLENWTAQNPIMYYKHYIQSKDITLNKNEVSTIESALKIEDGEFNNLSSDDIIIVRTYKFDLKD